MWATLPLKRHLKSFSLLLGAAWQCDYNNRILILKNCTNRAVLFIAMAQNAFSCHSGILAVLTASPEFSSAEPKWTKFPPHSIHQCLSTYLTHKEGDSTAQYMHYMQGPVPSVGSTKTPCPFGRGGSPRRRGVPICSLAWKIRDERLPLLGSVLCVYIYLYKILSTVRGASCYSGGLRGVKKYWPFLTIGFNQKLLFCSQWSQQWGITLSDGDTVTGLAISSLMERQDGAMVTQTLGAFYSASFFAGSLGGDRIFGLPWGLQGSPMKRMKVSPKPKVS